MAMDIFSTFDDHNKVIIDAYLLIWMTLITFAILLMKKMWLTSSKLSFFNTMKSVVTELITRSNMKMMLGSSSLMTAIMTTVLTLNLFGLTPYTFSATSHLVINLSLTLILWMHILMMSMSFNLSEFLAHLQPLGAPAMINPFLCLIELVSLLVRPLTLAVRLTANLSTGHILMSLLGTGMTSSPLPVSLLLMMMGSAYCMFEMGVCFVQAYIFTLLPTLYADEHPENID
uniref:ATP synthase subunit a n=1 Tax=Bugula neritina TaxID=10212 RepID=A9UK98_BUGNE|nr:ATP synthase F0 subunit 6 [Bugula neritina]AAT79557.1 ATP synthase F0 subunit 6 [Bugula neritina]